MLVEVSLTDEREDGHPPTQERLAVGIGNGGRREGSVRRFVTAKSGFEAREIADTLRGTSLLPRPTHRPDEPGKKEPGECD